MIGKNQGWFSQGFMRRLTAGVVATSMALPAFLLPPVVPVAKAETNYVLAAVGDIACGEGTTRAPEKPSHICREDLVAGIINGINPDGFLALGDIQYEAGAYSDFIANYDTDFNTLKPKTQPVAGNHEYGTPSAKGYFDYFNGIDNFTGPAGDRDKGYYSYNVGDDWHIVVLNSNCISRDASTNDHAFAVDCAAGSPQEQWLRADLAANMSRPCTLAATHHPRYTAGDREDYTEIAPLWQALYDYGADVALAGHSHNYQQFLPTDNLEQLDEVYGIRSFVIGTGGKELSTASNTTTNSTDPTLVMRHSGVGALKMNLETNGYSWEMVSAPEYPVSDSGSALCHGIPGTPNPSPTITPSTTIVASEASYVKSTEPTSIRNNVDSDSLRTRAAATIGTTTYPEETSYYKFDLSSLAGKTIQKAYFKVFTKQGSTHSPEVREVSDDSWQETTLTYNNKPAADGAVIGNVVSNSHNNDWVQTDITQAIIDNLGQADYTYSLATVATEGVEEPLRVLSNETAVEKPHLFVQYTDAAPPATVTVTESFNAIADTYVDSSNSGLNYGTAMGLLASASVRRSFLKFAPTLPQDATIQSVALDQYVLATSNNAGFEIHPMGGAWDEATTTWANQPTWDATILATSAAPTSGSRLVTPLPTSVLNNGVAELGIKYSTAGFNGQFGSRENTDKEPKLTITYTTAAPAPTPIPTVVPTPVPTPTPHQIITTESFSPTEDAYVESNSSTTTEIDESTVNYGSVTNLIASASARRAFLKFVPTLPQDATVQSISLDQYPLVSGSSGGFTVHPMTGPWSEAIVTWANQPTWDATVLATSTTPTANTRVVTSLPTSVWNNGEVNLGIKYSASGFNGQFGSRENVGKEPKLIVTYATPAPMQTATFTASADTFVESNSSTTTEIDESTVNYGSVTNLIASASVRRAFLRFAAALPETAIVHSVSLDQYPLVSGSSGGFTVHPMTGAWDEATVTWANQPTWDATVLATSATPVANTRVTTSLPTSVWNNGEVNLGIKYSASGFNSQFGSKENTGKEPRLIVTYTVAQ